MIGGDKKITVKTLAGDIVFYGFHRPTLSNADETCFETDSGQIYRFYKSNVVAILENEHLALVEKDIDDVKSAIERVCTELPEGNKITLVMELGSASVEFESEDGNILQFWTDSDGYISKKITSTLDEALLYIERLDN